MRFRIRHETVYRYAAPVALGPHVIRLRPREDGTQRLAHHALAITPAPVARSVVLDAEGNTVEHAWFGAPAAELVIRAESEVDTLRGNPFDFLDGHGADAEALAPYGAGDHPPEVHAFAASVRPQAAGGGTVALLDALNRAVHGHVHREIRDDGRPAQSPAETLALRRGACRDLAVLFIAAARVLGHPARFVSGYRRGDLARPDRHLHAWAEVHLPGGGWRGWDPVEGLAVADAHVALAASRTQAGAMPVSGSYAGDARGAALDYRVQIAVAD
jgi:transglutaminase-like putative cysteine protease